MPAISDELLSMIVCPESRQKLRVADDAIVAELNRKIAAGELKNVAGDVVKSPLDSGLVREDGAVLYPIVDGIPILLADEGIALAAGK